MRIILRVGLSLLFLMEAGLGILTQFFPRFFYDEIPTVDLTPPFSERQAASVTGADRLTAGLTAGLTAVRPPVPHGSQARSASLAR